MGGAAGVPPGANQLAHIERPARVLLGWLSAQEAEISQSGRGTRTPVVADAERAERARTAVVARAAGIDQTGVNRSANRIKRPHREIAAARSGVFWRGVASGNR
jgi:hypothetical protein